MKEINFKLPEFVFLDGKNHLGDTMEHRTVIQHIRTASIFEVIDLQETIEFNLNCETFKFQYKHPAGVIEEHLLALHFSLAEDEELEEIFKKVAKFYCNYLSWEDGNIIEDIISVQN
jgi:hypothetical protein